MAGTPAREQRLAPRRPQKCPRCPRLVAYRRENETKEPSWFNGAVPSFGGSDAQLLIVGLAPGRNGANRTGRPFTGDYAGVLLYETLLKFGFAEGEYQARADDGLELVDCMITNAVRCVPPENKPEPSEITNLPAFLRGAPRPFAATQGDPGARPYRTRTNAYDAEQEKGAVPLCSWCPPRPRRRSRAVR